MADLAHALDSLAKIKGMYQTKVEISGVMSLVDRVQAARAQLSSAKEPK